VSPPRSVVHTWKQAGRLFFWRFTENTRNFPGWHFMVDREASVSIAALLRSMAKSETTCSRTVVVSLPTAEVLAKPNNRNAGCFAPERLRIELVHSGVKVWTLIEDGAVVHWQLSADGLRAAAEVFANPAEYFDSSIGEEPVLWSWGLLTGSPSKASLKRTRAKK
jgi:hypothetical protein